MKKTENGKYWSSARLLAIVGAVIAIIEAILGFAGGLNAIVGGIVVIVLAVLTLASLGLIKAIKFPSHWIIMLVFGIVCIVLGAWIGGIIILVAGVVALVGVV